MSDIFINRPTQEGFSFGGNNPNLTAVPQPFMSAVVVDVIVDHTHPKYNQTDGFNVGSAKVRIFSINHTADEDVLPWADPLDSGLQQLPLVGEIVSVYEIFGSKFYSRPLRLSRLPQQNAAINLNKILNNRGTNTLANVLTGGQELLQSKHKFGTYFKPDSRVRQLKHFEGDTIIEGRMGHSIRFGSSRVDPSSDGMAPNLILRAGQAKGAESGPITRPTPYGLILEDINKDASSIWMVADQTIPFLPATSKAGSFVRSVTSPPQKFDKAQVIINSDRVVLNAKKASIMLFSNEEINLNSFKNTTIDTDANIFLSANEEINFKSNKNIEAVTDEDFTITAGSDITSLSMEKISSISKKIYLGSVDNDEEPMVGGTSLSKFLARFIHALVNGEASEPPKSFTPGANQTNHVITPMGPGLLAPAVVSALKTLYNELVAQNAGQEKNKLDFAGAPFNSQANFVMLQNEEPDMVKNEFKPGEQHSIESNEWILSQTYYRV